MLHVVFCVAALALLGSVALANTSRSHDLPGITRHLRWLALFGLLQGTAEIAGAGMLDSSHAAAWAAALDLAAGLVLGEFLRRGVDELPLARPLAGVRAKQIGLGLVALTALAGALSPTPWSSAAAAGRYLITVPAVIATGVALGSAFWATTNRIDRALAMTLPVAFAGYGIALAVRGAGLDGPGTMAVAPVAVCAFCISLAAVAFAALTARQGARTREALDREREFARRLVDSAPIIVVVLSPDGTIVHANPALERVSGWRLDEILGRDWFTTFLPEDARARVRRRFDSIIAGVEPRDGTNQILTKTGAARLIEWRNQTLREANGRTSAVLATGLDVTERHESDRTLRASERRYRRLIDEAPYVVLALDASGDIKAINPAGLRMMEQRDDSALLGRPGVDLFEPADRTRLRASLAGVREGHRRTEADVRTTTGRVMDLTVVSTDGGSAIAIGVDVTDARRLAAREAERLRRLEQLAEFGLSLTGHPGVVLPGILRMTAALFDVPVVVLSEPTGDELRFRLALVNGDFTEALPPCPLDETPGGVVARTRTLQILHRVADRYPASPLLRRHAGDTYCGVPILLDERRRDYTDEDRHMLRIVAQRIGVELERQRNEARRVTIEQELARSEERLRRAQRIAGIGNWELDLRTGELWWSDEAYRLFGLDRASFLPSYDAFLALIHPDDRDAVDQAYARSLADRTPYQIVHRLLVNDRLLHVEERCETDFDVDGSPLRSRGTVQDVTSDVEAEGALRDSLIEKETLLREIHHRVKNNLQVVSALLQFQARQVRDPQDAVVLQEARDRLRAMALVHETLYRSKGLSRVDFTSYLYGLVGELQRSYSSNRQTAVRIVADDVTLPVERALPCGMLVCELLTNAFKHAFPGRERGEVTVRLRLAGDAVTLVVQDSGVGLPTHVDPDAATSFGWQLIRALTAQLGGSTTVERARGTTVMTSFPRTTP